MNIDVADGSYYKVNKYLMYITGQWPYYSKIERCLILSFVYPSLISLLVPEVLGLYTTWGDVDTTIECLPPILIMLGSIFLLTNNNLNTKKIAIIFEKINRDWITWSSGREFEILCSYTARGKFFGVAYTSYCFVTMFLFLLLPVVPQILDLIMPLNESRSKKSLYPTEYYVDVDDYFYSMLVHGYISSIMCVLVFLCVDTTFMTINQHACGILSILGYQLKNITQIDNKNGTVDRSIAFCAKIYLEVTIFVDDIRDCFSTVFFLVLGVNMSLLTITGVETVMKMDYPNDAMRFGAFTFAQLIHLLYLSVPCQELIDHSIQISDCIYESCWYELPVSCQKMLLIIMRRSEVPCTFTAGKMYTYSIRSFASVLHTSMSYFTVLSSVR